MSHPEDQEGQQHVSNQQVKDPPVPHAAVDVENQTQGAAAPASAGANQTATAAAEGANQKSGVSEGIVRLWKRENMLNKASLVLRGLGLFLSFISFIVMACNKQGDWKDFDKYEEYRYVLAIGVIATVYTAVQVARQVHELSTGKHMIGRRVWTLLDFSGDQVMAYLLLSAASAAIPLTTRMREVVDDLLTDSSAESISLCFLAGADDVFTGAYNVFTDSSAASICMCFLAFFALALSALISVYKLSTQSYI